MFNVQGIQSKRRKDKPYIEEKSLQKTSSKCGNRGYGMMEWELKKYSTPGLRKGLISLNVG